MARTKFSDLRKQVEARPGARLRLAVERAETLEEMQLFELRQAEAVSQAVTSPMARCSRSTS
jgi:hypothetical protein